MIYVNIEFDHKKIPGFLTKLSGKEITKAVTRSLNRTAVSVRAQMARSVREELRAPIAEIKDRLSIRKASSKGSDFNAVQASIIVSPKAMPMDLFSPQPKYVMAQIKTKSGAKSVRRRGVTVLIKKQRKLVPGAFLARINGRQSIWARKGSARGPVARLYTTTVRDIVENVGFVDRVHGFASMTFMKNFDHELKRMIEKSGK